MGLHEKAQYFIKGSFVNGGKTYNRLKKAGESRWIDCQNWQVFNYPVGGIREDSNRFYVYLDTTEWLLYDFNLKVGDSHPYSYVIRPDLFLSQPVVDSIDSIYIQNRYHRRLYFTCPDSFSTFYIVEGIGSQNGLLESPCGFETASTLTCFRQQGESVFPPDPYGCDLVSVPGQESLNVQMVPNPLSAGSRIIGLPTRTRISVQVFDILGREVSTYRNVHTDELHLNPVDFTKGMYLFRTKSTYGEGYGKFVVE